MSVPIVLSPDTCYVTKTNIKFPGTAGQATLAEAAADTRIEDNLPTGVTVTIAGGTIKVANP